MLNSHNLYLSRLRSLCLLALLVGAPQWASAHQLGAALIKVAALNTPVAGQLEIRTELHAPVDTNGRPPTVFVEVGNDCTTLGQNSRADDDEVVRYWWGQCKDFFIGRELTVLGLSAQTPDAILVVEYPADEIAHFTLNQKLNRVTIPAPTEAAVQPAVSQYFEMGVAHIWSGYDHLLLVLLLCLLASGKQLVWVVTSFTLAHSISLAGATLWQWQLPSQPVEAVIALSLVSLAAECLRRHRNPNYQSISLSQPALMAFIFGLIHGLGFAGALAEVGLPSETQWLALLLFNLGVETGQLAFIATMMVVYRMLQTTIIVQALPNIKPPMLYSIGGLSAFWLWQRLL